jgi:hypothetical protein
MVLSLVDTTVRTCTVIISSDFKYVTNRIMCMKFNLDVSALEKICNVSYHWVLISENSPFFRVGQCVSL